MYSIVRRRSRNCIIVNLIIRGALELIVGHFTTRLLLCNTTRARRVLRRTIFFEKLDGEPGSGQPESDFSSVKIIAYKTLLTHLLADTDVVDHRSGSPGRQNRHGIGEIQRMQTSMWARSARKRLTHRHRACFFYIPYAGQRQRREKENLHRLRACWLFQSLWYIYREEFNPFLSQMHTYF